MLRLNATLTALALAATLVAGCGHAVGSAAQRTVGSMSAHALQDALDTHAETPDDADELPMLDAGGPEPVGIHMPALHSRLGLADKPEMLSIPSPNYGKRPAGMAIDTLIMHHTSDTASAQRIGAFFAKPSSKVSAHYVVGKDGVIVQCVDDSLSAWHAGVSAFQGRNNVNSFSIGIEMCNVGDGVDPYTDEEYKALGKLVAYILDSHHIKWDHVTGHKDVALPKGRKDDPSPNFSYDRMKAEVAAVDPNAGK